MKINKQTMLFEELTEKDFYDMALWAEDVVLRGKIAWPDPPWVQQWLEAFGYDSDRRLLVISTALPQRVLLSLLHWRA